MMFLQRFCFGGKSDRKWTDAFARCKSHWDLHKHGIKDIQAYENGEVLFIVVDTLEGKSRNQLQGVISGMVRGDKEMAFLGQLMGNGFFSALDRIFTKNNVQELKDVEPCKRIAMALKLKKDPFLLEEYKEIHAPNRIWPQVLDNMDAMGIKDMELYLMGYQAFLIMDVPPNFDLEKQGAIWSQLPQEADWQQYVSKFQEVNPHSNAVDKWKVVEQV
ncbi:MAG: L-rhamnose mutarotase [Flavobacteriaceae bacterium]